MESVFINVSNHPSADWQADQLNVAKRIGIVYDIPFPIISPDKDTEEVAKLAYAYRKKIKEILPEPDGISVIHVMGESVFTFILVSLLLSEQYLVVASTTERIVFHDGDKKISTFKFVRFRSYN